MTLTWLEISARMRPDAERRAFAPLFPDSGAFDVANKIGVILKQSSWLLINIKIVNIKSKTKRDLGS